MTLIEPARQGEYDRTCGFYAIGNALSLLFPERRREDFFQLSLGQVKAENILEGASTNQLNTALNTVIESLAQEGVILSKRTPFWRRKNVRRDEFLNHVYEFMNNKAPNAEIRVMITCYWYWHPEGEDLHHWTVVSKVTPKNWWAFDSLPQGCKKVDLEKCRVAFENRDESLRRSRSKPFLLYPETSIYLSA